jgi:uncharacterized membrane-anchored protein/tetratricopeptide (TPR) repeat protein
MRMLAAGRYRATALAVAATLITIGGASPALAARPGQKATTIHPAFGPADRAAQHGPALIPVRDEATLSLRDVHMFIPRPEADALMRLFGNEFGPSFVGIVFTQNGYVVVEYHASGHVEESEARTWKPDAMLARIRARSDASHSARGAAGTSIKVTGWAKRPTYDAKNKRLAWSLALSESTRVSESKDGGSAAHGAAVGINDSAIVLGRTGYVELNVVTELSEGEARTAQVATLVEGVRFNRGRRYAEYDAARDPKAAFGLTALVSGDTTLAPVEPRPFPRMNDARREPPPVPATQIGTRFVVRAPLAEHRQAGRTLWIDLYRVNISLMVDLPAVPDTEELIELIETAEDDGRSAIVRYELADGALAQNGHPIAMLRSIEHGGVSVAGMQGPLVFPFADPDRPARAAELALGRGVAYLEAQRLEPAIRLLGQALASNALGDLARILALRSRGQAQQYVVEDSRRDPTTESDRTLLAAIEDFRAWQELEPASLAPLDKEADILQSLGAYDEALAIYRRVRDEQQDGWFWPSIKIAATYRLMGDHLRALGTLDELERRPRGWDGMAYRYHRGWTLVRLGRYADAEATFTVGLESQPDFGWARVGRACARSAQGKLTDALADLESAIADLEPPEGVRNTAQQQRDLEQTRSVAEMLRGAVADPPEVPPREPCRLFLEALDRPRTRSPELVKLKAPAS